MARLNGLVVLLILLFPTNNIYANDIGQFIWGGETVKEDHPIAKSTVSLVCGRSFCCSAVLIDEDIALTAAHCVDSNKAYKISFGINARSNKNATRKVIEKKIHEKWDTRKIKYDIAILEFEGGLPKDFVARKLVPKGTKYKITRGDYVRAAGYGTSTKKPDGVGNGKLRTTRLKVHRSFDFGRPGVFRLLLDKSGICYGDSGGPHYFEEKKNGKTEYYVAGISSFVSGKTRNSRGPYCDKYGGVSSVDYYRSWIENAIEEVRENE